MDPSEVPLLTRRRIEAAALAQVYRVLSDGLGEDAALEIIGRAVAADAREAGRRFAQAARPGPSLEHFATVLDRWRAGGALTIEGVRCGGGLLEFRVTRCAYVEAYRAMGLPPALAYPLSCGRDAAFASGYRVGLTLERSPTLAEGSSACRFRFRWGAPEG
ncbi:MAG: L-2-amino-thiazoline-4-carboxylic acid hydrolase [Deferrisomatales bacterium]